MRISACHPKGTNASPARNARGAVPRGALPMDTKRRLFQRDIGIERLESHQRRDSAVLHLQNNFEDSCDPSGAFGMTDIRLGGSDGAELLFLGEACKRAFEAVYFDWIAQLGPGAVGFHIT